MLKTKIVAIESDGTDLSDFAASCEKNLNETITSLFISGVRILNVQPFPVKTVYSYGYEDLSGNYNTGSAKSEGVLFLITYED